MFALVRRCSFPAAVLAVVSLVLIESVFAQSKREDRVEIKPYTGPPIFLDEPEAQPDATLVGRVVDTQKYKDGKVRVEREIAKYSDNRLVADGFYREFYPDGQKFAEGKYEKGRQSGEWTYWHENGKVARTVSYKDGQPDGSWEVFSPEGAVIAQRGYKNGKRDGTWMVFDKTGKQSLRQEQYADGMADGTWKVWFPSGQLQQEIGFKEGKRSGPTIMWDEKGTKRAEVNYADNLLEGTASLWGIDGKKITQQYSKGKLVSESKE